MKRCLCTKWSVSCARNEASLVHEMKRCLCTKWSVACARNEPLLVHEMKRSLCTKWSVACARNKAFLVHKMKRCLCTKWNVACARNEALLVHEMKRFLCTKWRHGGEVEVFLDSFMTLKFVECEVHFTQGQFTPAEQMIFSLNSDHCTVSLTQDIGVKEQCEITGT